MNMLIDKFPETVLIDDIEYEINTDFRDCLFTVIQLKGEIYSPDEKIDILINNMYNTDPHDIKQATEQASWFLRCGEAMKKTTREYCDFEHDSRYIYSALIKSGIDLNKIEYMHWWEFIARLQELPECTWSRIIYLRVQNSKGKLTKPEQEECKQIGWNVINMHYYVPDPDSY